MICFLFWEEMRMTAKSIDRQIMHEYRHG